MVMVLYDDIVFHIKQNHLDLQIIGIDIDDYDRNKHEINPIANMSEAFNKIKDDIKNLSDPTGIEFDKIFLYMAKMQHVDVTL
ncbi:unnamed protein product [Rotaria sordida]|uniref:Uncharacterized protein n=1 Tax=Rotaria sordida TaxID=392033 RepID=A0A814LJU0_9BILA|nr:unnamed protein product [Rotaria sordida]CAF1244360.1 unnamed protein product [Rotaria sordida]